MRRRDAQDFYHFNLHLLENALLLADRLSAQTGKLVRYSIVYDSFGMGMRHASARLVKRMTPTLPLPDLYYPELVGCVVLSNAPWAMHVLWGMLRHFISKVPPPSHSAPLSTSHRTTLEHFSLLTPAHTLVTQPCTGYNMRCRVARRMACAGAAGARPDRLRQGDHGDAAHAPAACAAHPEADGRRRGGMHACGRRALVRVRHP
jgi:hypothetical protein